MYIYIILAFVMRSVFECRTSRSFCNEWTKRKKQIEITQIGRYYVMLIFYISLLT